MIAAPIAIDLYCLSCGYNLRGLSGDPVRCPECGFRNPIGEMEPAAEAISLHLRDAEAALVLVATGVLIALPGVLLAGVMLSSRVTGTFVAATAAGFLVSALTCLASGVARFRSLVNHRPGWGAAVLLHTAYVVVLVLIVVLPFVGVTSYFVSSRSRGIPFYAMAPTAFVTALVLIFTVLRPLYAKMKETIEPLRREVALTLTRDLARRRTAEAERRALRGP
ncbi:hypothetical protein RAS1_33190 [Phycisphaerae bacterium RAS1]|nr:hypothetical protein RAS1_33190 [Phycisphaerae bacterium RAS1]